MTSQDRWTKLTNLTAAFGDKYIADRDSTAWFAGRVGNELKKFLGCPDDSRIQFYEYEIGVTPEYDRFSPSPTPNEAVTPGENGYWGFGIGVTLERGILQFPRFTFHWGMSVKKSGTQWSCYIALIEKEISLEQDGAGNLDFAPICEALYQGLIKTLNDAAQGQPLKRAVGYAVNGV